MKYKPTEHFHVFIKVFITCHFPVSIHVHRRHLYCFFAFVLCTDVSTSRCGVASQITRQVVILKPIRAFGLPQRAFRHVEGLLLWIVFSFPLFVLYRSAVTRSEFQCVTRLMNSCQLLHVNRQMCQFVIVLISACQQHNSQSKQPSRCCQAAFRSCLQTPERGTEMGKLFRAQTGGEDPSVMRSVFLTKLL